MMEIDPDRRFSKEEERRWEALREMTPEESAALGEALLTSEIMDLARFPEERRPVSLARSLGIRPERLGGRK